MFKLLIEEEKTFEIKEELYFDSIKDIEEYLIKCFPYQKERLINILKDSCSEISFCILKDTKKICGISISEIIPHKKTNLKAWNGKNTPIYEVFHSEDVFLIEEKYWEWFNNIEEDYKDSLRICKKSDDKAMKEYKLLNSCCGSIDEEIEINGEIYLFGCNFGH